MNFCCVPISVDVSHCAEMLLMPSFSLAFRCASEILCQETLTIHFFPIHLQSGIFNRYRDNSVKLLLLKIHFKLLIFRTPDS